ncbi:hypothetical protein J1605_017454 [Eschrichtius robustus]|uniref:Uncharacterized protein n=1 Tax=Eschrichtius robustus TaxID=9764 RepID=A0AB34I2A4_ESCRO|nr:hypothetical protein J1605_017454 [Eschrichtius robustus]
MQREGRAAEQLGAGVSKCASGPGSAAADPPPAGSRPGVLHSVTRAARRPAALQPRAPAPATAAGPERAPAPPLRSLRYLEPERAREREKGCTASGQESPVVVPCQGGTMAASRTASRASRDIANVMQRLQALTVHPTEALNPNKSQPARGDLSSAKGIE